MDEKRSTKKSILDLVGVLHDPSHEQPIQVEAFGVGAEVPFPRKLYDRIETLIDGVEVDLDEALPDEDD